MRGICKPCTSAKKPETPDLSAPGFKRCALCKSVKTLEEFGDAFLVSAGAVCRCLECRERSYVRKTDPVKRDDAGKVCKKCGLYKPFDAFYAKKIKSVDGHTSQCKECIKAKATEYRQRPDVQSRKNDDDWRQRQREYQTEWGNLNRQKKNSYADAYRQRHPDRKWTYQVARARAGDDAAFRAKVCERSHRRRARVKGAGGRYTLKQWAALCAGYENRCLRCGQTKKLTADHIIPITRGGTNNIDNIQPLCKSCNSAKGARHCTDYRPLFKPSGLTPEPSSAETPGPAARR